MKRQREADERERVRQREARRAERRAARGLARADTPDPDAPTTEPVLGVDGPRSLAELRAAQSAAASGDSGDDGDPDGSGDTGASQP
jgi:hypothetical protein